MLCGVTEQGYQRRFEPRKEAFGPAYEIRSGLLRRGIYQPVINVIVKFLRFPYPNTYGSDLAFLCRIYYLYLYVDIIKFISHT